MLVNSSYVAVFPSLASHCNLLLCKSDRPIFMYLPEKQHSAYVSIFSASGDHAVNKTVFYKTMAFSGVFIGRIGSA